MTPDLDVIWHDLECGSYDLDLAGWRELAQAARGPVLDVGAGTGRVTLDLARRGHEVVALDAEASLLAALRERAGGLLVETVHADARELDVDRRFPLIIVPMQTLQLLGGSAGRTAFLTRARAHLTDDGIVAMAIADALEGAAVGEYSEPPRPEMREIDGVVYSSRAVAITDEGDRCAIFRIRETVDEVGAHTAQENVVRLDALDPATLEGEGRAAGLRILPRGSVPESDEYIGSTVVMLGA
jgi:SAM-dependent methyltransferase